MHNIIKGKKINDDLLLKYKDVLPDDIILLWKEYGLCEFLDGYLRVINPDDYRELLENTYFAANTAIPIMTTAFGDVLTIEDKKYINIIRYKNGEFSVIDTIKFFLKDLDDEYFLNTKFEISNYENAVKRLGKLKPDECFGYVPLLGLGGSEKIENLEIVKTQEHIALIAQLVGKIGMD